MFFVNETYEQWLDTILADFYQNLDVELQRMSLYFDQ